MAASSGQFDRIRGFRGRLRSGGGRQGPGGTGRRSLTRQVGGLLEGLGSSGQEVAQTLASQGVQGNPGDVLQCALAVYLRAVLGADPRVRSVAVTDRWVNVGTAWRTHLVVEPPAVRTFIHLFDAGRFPELVRSDVAQRSQVNGATVNAD